MRTWNLISLLIFSVLIRTQEVNSNYHNPKPDSGFWQNTSQHHHRELSRVWVAKALDFGFPSQQAYYEALNSGKYVPGSELPVDVDVYYGPHGPRMFTTIPRFGSGVPYSLAEVTKLCTPRGSLLQAYPSYDWHSSHGKNCDGLTSVYRMQIDRWGRMWVLDSGEIDYVQHCPPSIRVFNLNDNRLIFSYYFPKEVYKSGTSRFITIYVDFVESSYSKVPEEAYVCSADVSGFGIVVTHVNLENKYDKPRSWRIENKFTYPDPDFGTISVAGTNFELMDGTFGLSVTPPKLGLEPKLYFHSLASDLQMAIPLDVVRNESNWNSGYESALTEFQRLGNRCIQCPIEIMTYNGFQLCAHLNPLAIFAWDIRTPFTARNVINVLENPRTLQFNSGAKTIFNPNTKQEEVVLMTNSIQKFWVGSIDYNEVNFRIQCCQTDQLLSKTQPCTCGISEAFLCLRD